MKTVSNFLRMATKFSGSRDYSNVVRFSDYNGRHEYEYTNGYFAACLVMRHTNNVYMSRQSSLIPVGHDRCSEYPDINKAIGFDITNPSLKDCDIEKATNDGIAIINALSNVKIGKSTYINVDTLSVVHAVKDTNGESWINAHWLMSVLDCVDDKRKYLYYWGRTKDGGCHMFSVSGQISLVIAPTAEK